MKFLWYVVTVLLDVFISLVLFKPLYTFFAGLPFLRCGYQSIANGLASSIIGIVTFQAYANKTRFLWAYPATESQSNAGWIKGSTMQLVVAIMTMVYLVSNTQAVPSEGGINHPKVKLWVALLTLGLILVLEKSGTLDAKLALGFEHSWDTVDHLRVTDEIFTKYVPDIAALRSAAAADPGYEEAARPAAQLKTATGRALQIWVRYKERLTPMYVTHLLGYECYIPREEREVADAAAEVVDGKLDEPYTESSTDADGVTRTTTLTHATARRFTTDPNVEPVVAVTARDLRRAGREVPSQTTTGQLASPIPYDGGVVLTHVRGAVYHTDPTTVLTAAPPKGFNSLTGELDGDPRDDGLTHCLPKYRMRTAVDHDFVLPEGRVTMDETRGRWPQGLAILLGIAAITAGITVFGTSKRASASRRRPLPAWSSRCWPWRRRSSGALVRRATRSRKIPRPPSKKERWCPRRSSSRWRWPWVSWWAW